MNKSVWALLKIPGVFFRMLEAHVFWDGMTAMAQLSGNVILIAVSLGAKKNVKFRDLAIFFPRCNDCFQFHDGPAPVRPKIWPSFKNSRIYPSNNLVMDPPESSLMFEGGILRITSVKPVDFQGMLQVEKCFLSKCYGWFNSLIKGRCFFHSQTYSIFQG